MRAATHFLPMLVLMGLTISACSPTAAARIARADVQRDTNPGVTETKLSQLAGANNEFALDLYQSLHPQDGNLVFSPFSISLALAMTYAGSRNATEAEMAQTLHFELPQESLHPAFNQLDLALTEPGGATAGAGQPLQLNVANAIWAEQTLSFLPKYLDVIARNYGAGVQLADFIHEPEVVRQQINQWVSGQTQKKIQNLIPPGAFGDSARMVLVNAVYFKGDWLDPFDPNETRQASFTLPDGSRRLAQFMSNDGLSAPYAAGDGFQAVELPYQGGNAVMDIILPDAGTFASFENQFDIRKLNEVLGSLQPTTLALDLPKFKFDTDFDLGDQLAALGMPDAFNPDVADFSGMTGGRDLFISKILHQSMVAVDEKGTEAAAATAVIMAPTSILRTDVTMKVDHPFIFVIRDVRSGQILFMGRVLDPTQ